MTKDRIAAMRTHIEEQIKAYESWCGDHYGMPGMASELMALESYRLALLGLAFRELGGLAPFVIEFAKARVFDCPSDFEPGDYENLSALAKALREAGR